MNKNNESTEHVYVTPLCEVFTVEVGGGLCLSRRGELPPVEEEDAGIDEWSS